MIAWYLGYLLLLVFRYIVADWSNISVIKLIDSKKVNWGMNELNLQDLTIYSTWNNDCIKLNRELI